MMTAITDDNAQQFRTGRLTVGTSAVQLSGTSFKITRGVQIKAASGNAGVIYSGAAATVTANAADATDGFPLAASEGLFIPVDDLSKIWFIADSASQVLWWFAV